MVTTLKAPFDLSEIEADQPIYTKHNRDPYNNRYRATIRIGGRVLNWTSYDFDHLNKRIKDAGYEYCVSCFHIESADLFA